jgi:hypothetical protein
MSKPRRFKFADCKDCIHGVGRAHAACLSCTAGENFEEKIEEPDEADLFEFIEEMEDGD